MAGYIGQSDPGAQYDRYLAHNEQSTLHKFKETYWTTKQAVIKKLGKKEDAHVVASDAQLDAKLEVFKAIQTSCMDLLRALEKYQDRLCVLSQEENSTGRFLKTVSQQDKTRAGKMMAAVGKSQSFSSQQRLALRVPLVRLYQEVETFRYRAISDTLMTINRMESARTEYRGALLWMKDISEEFDPDSYKQLEKFRKVQAQVKKTKARFDKLKLDTMQKIDLLAASRCNMFSHVLANYQTTLLHFWDKTSRTMTAVSESFKGYQYYEFNMLKLLAEVGSDVTSEEAAESLSDAGSAEELCEPSKKLAEKTGNRAEAEKEADAKHGDETDEEDKACEDDDLLSLNMRTDSPSPSGEPQDADALLGLDSDNPFNSLERNDPHRPDLDLDINGLPLGAPLLSPTGSSLIKPKLPDTSKIPKLPLSPQARSRQPVSSGSASPKKDHVDPDLVELISFGEDEEEDASKSETAEKKSRNDGSMTNLLEEIDKEISRPAKKPGTEANDFLDFGTDEERTIEEIKLAQDRKFDLNRGPVNVAKDAGKGKGKGQASRDLLSDDLDHDDLEKDDMTLLNEILNAPSSGEDEFTREWQAVFGTTPLSSTAQFTPVETDQSQSDFMPSSLLDLSAPLGAMSLGAAQGASRMSGMCMATAGMPAQQSMAMASAMGQLPQQQPQQHQQPQQQQQKPKTKKGQKTDMSAWFNLFADLDPLANPDAIGKRPEDITDA